VGLLGKLARFEGQRAGSDLDLAPLQFNVVHVTRFYLRMPRRLMRSA
jgi:hypothetical protein